LVAIAVTTLDSWRHDARKNLEYASRLRYTDPKLCMEIIIDLLDQLLQRLPRETVE